MSIPIDLSSPEDEALAALEEEGVKGRCASLQRILELPGDKIEWRMATTSSAGGLIPQFVTDSVLPEAVSKVIPSILMGGFVSNCMSTRPGCTFSVTVDRSEEGDDWQHQITRVGSACPLLPSPPLLLSPTVARLQVS